MSQSGHSQSGILISGCRVCIVLTVPFKTRHDESKGLALQNEYLSCIWIMISGLWLNLSHFLIFSPFLHFWLLSTRWTLCLQRVHLAKFFSCLLPYAPPMLFQENKCPSETVLSLSKSWLPPDLQKTMTWVVVFQRVLVYRS